MPTPRRSRAVSALAIVLSLPPGLVFAAQSAPEAQQPAAAPRDATTAGAAAAADTYDTIEREYNAAMQGFSKVYREAKDDAERKKLVEEKYPRAEEYAGRMLALAEKKPEDPKAIDALIWVTTRGRGTPAFAKALAQIRDHHIRSEKLASIAQGLVYSGDDNAVALLDRMVAENPHREVKGAATYARADYYMNRNKTAEAEKGFEEVVAKYGDVKHYRGTLADAAKSQLFEIRNLSIGKVAPEIEGEDVDGKKFKLSEYRGKVVVLDFWGDW